MPAPPLARASLCKLSGALETNKGRGITHAPYKIRQNDGRLLLTFERHFFLLAVQIGGIGFLFNHCQFVFLRLADAKI
jgi:hypothetical protein